MWPALLTFSLMSALPALADEASDEQEDPALRKPLPEFAAPVARDEETSVFSTEAPPPPAFDPSYQAPEPAADEEEENKP